MKEKSLSRVKNYRSVMCIRQAVKLKASAETQSLGFELATSFRRWGIVLCVIHFILILQ